MGYKLKHHHLNQIFGIIEKDYKVFAVDEKSGQFKQIFKPGSAKWLNGRAIMPPKKLIFPDSQSTVDASKEKIALIGIPLCDISAIHQLISKLEESSLVTKREDLFLIGGECKPDDDCFCEFFGTDKLRGFDIYIQKDGNNFIGFSGTDLGERILKKLRLKKDEKTELKPVTHKSLNKLSKEEITKLVANKDKFIDLWQKLANNCFGCGACTAVCPLCYCFRQDEKNLLNGEVATCINWDSCFACEFSEIQNRLDLRPKNVDRFYNWYHHKFVRSPYLCVGCGRCIKACPANLNIKNILLSIEKMDEDEDKI